MRVWVTRDEGPDGPLSCALRAAGQEPVLEPVLTRHVVDDARAQIAGLGPDDWLVLTSPFAVEAVPPDVAAVPRVAVVGEASRALAAARGFRVEFVSPEGSGQSLFAELFTGAAGCRVCYPRSSLASVPDAPENVTLLSPILYETRPRPYRGDVIDRVDVVSLASPSAARAVGRVELRYASIGAATTAALRELGVRPWAEAATPGFPALARAIADQADASLNQRA